MIRIGTINGLCRCVTVKGRFIFTSPGFKRDPGPIHALLADSKGNLWFTDTTGLCKVSRDNPAACTTYTTGDGLIHHTIYSLFEDSRGDIWIGTRKGADCFSGGKFTHYTTADGLPDEACHFILEDGGGNIWIGTGKGVSRFNGKSFKTYTARDGLISSGMSQGAGLKDSRGNLWFGTANGVSRFNPELDRVNRVPPPVYITGLKVFGKNFPMTGGTPFHFEHNRNYLGFDFTGISFTSPEDVVFKYQLNGDGIEQDWFETRSRSISFPYLPPGDYVFKVAARNKDNVESPEAAEFRFRILAGGAVHDLKNLLSIIIGYSKMAVRGSGTVGAAGGAGAKNDVVEKIKTTAMTAVQVVKQILAFTRGGYDKTMAANLPDLVDDILAILQVTTPAEIKIRWQRPEEEVRLDINPTKFQQVVMNLCFNAIQAMPDGGELKISLEKSRGRTAQVILEVSDTGRGMIKEVRDQIFDPLFTTKESGKGTGLGLFVVKQIVGESGGTIRVRSTPGQGTTFTIII